MENTRQRRAPLSRCYQPLPVRHYVVHPAEFALAMVVGLIVMAFALPVAIGVFGAIVKGLVE